MKTQYIKDGLTVVAILFGLLIASTASASTEVPLHKQTMTLRAPLHSNTLSASTIKNAGGAGTIAWSNPSYAMASDNQRATVTLQTAQTSKYLKATGFGFNVPDNAVIGGVLVEVETSEGLPGTTIQNSSIRLVVGGTVQGDDKAGGCITTLDTYIPYGSSTELWGLTLTPAAINDANFGVATAYLAMIDDTVRVDHIRITVYYSSRLYENTDSQITYGTGWTNVNEARASGGSYRTKSQPGSTACLTFNGADRVGIGRVLGTNQGKMRVTIDGSPVTASPFDNYTSYSDAHATSFHSFVWAHESLTTSSHTICVEPDGTKNPASASTQIGFDYFVIGIGNKMAQRGMISQFTTLSQNDLNASWNFNGYLAPNYPVNWNGFIPKISDAGKVVTTTEVNSVIDGATGQSAPVPEYWILLNEPDDPYWGDNDPTQQAIHDTVVTNINNIKSQYATRGYPTPKFIIESGTQYHAPRGTTPTAADAWGNRVCGVDEEDVFGQPIGDYWACVNPNGIWIEQFWTKFSTDHPELVGDIAGFGGHYYQRADNESNCPVSTCTFSTSRVREFTDALRDWANSRGLGSKQIWLTETATAFIHTDTNCPDGDSVLGQRNGVSCLGSTYNPRDYVSQLQDVLAQQGIVTRWAWYADRYGGYHQCSQGGIADTDYAVNTEDGGVSDGEYTALNASCSAAVLSPYGVNYSVAAPYR